MKRNYNIMLLVLVLAFGSCSFTAKVDDNPDKDKLLIQIITLALDQLHFEPKQLNDAFSAEIYSDYLELVDPLKRYFLQSDIDDFKKFETEIDDQLKAYDISFFNVVHERLIQRQQDAKQYYKDILEKPFNFDKDEDYNTDYEALPYAKNKKALKERWRQQLKFNTLSSYSDAIDQQENEKITKKDNHIFEEGTNESTTENEPVVKKSLTELEEEARAETLKTLDNYFTDYIEDMDREDWFSMYVNTIVEEFDPHTSYMAPTDKERFYQQMSGKLECIAARLQ
ncbi:MAG: tail-specific protease, partial [Olleya sp.]